MKIRLEVNETQKQTILEVLRAYGITNLHTPCGGRGRCGKCTVQVEGLGDVLACITEAENGMVIQMPEDGQLNIADGSDCVCYLSDKTEEFAAACDLGTTTVVCHLIDGRSSRIIATVSETNAQCTYGADVVSRIQAAKEGNLLDLHQQIVSQLNRMLGALLKQSGVEEIGRMAVAGNAVMCHLLAGISPETIGEAPFLPKDFFGKECAGSIIGLQHCRKVYIAPSVSGYVGGDITSDLLAVMPGHEEEETLLLDIGTNGEMVLGRKGDYVCCAAAGGPAFEGAQIAMGMPAKEGAVSHVYLDSRRIRVQVIGNTAAVGICGSGLLDALCIFLKMGLVDQSGRIRQPHEVSVAYRKYLGRYEEQDCIWLTTEVCVTQEDVRNLQLAKAAIAAGVEILFKQRNICFHQLKRLVLAGGFGTFLSPDSAAAIGLIPRELLDVTSAVGNAAGAGAVSAALSKNAREELDCIKTSMHYLELSANSEFEELYVKHMNF